MNKLKQVREQAGLSQSQLAKKSGVSFRSLQEYEQGRRPLEGASVIVVLRLAKALNCTIEDLIDVDE